MKFDPKPLSEQTVVITGATSGIGLTTAREAARRGARLVLVSRNEATLSELSDELNLAGSRAEFVVADVANRAALDQAAALAVRVFGGFDTWFNNAGVSIYGKLEEVAEEDSRRLFETNFWGVVNGSLIAATHFRERGGTLINVGSTLSDVTIPIQGMYCASKHAVKGFTNALRMELEADGANVNVSLIKPAAIDTPYKDHAKNYMKVEPQNPPPVYSPETVTEAILHCAENPVREVFVGAGAKLFSLSNEIAPRLTDVMIENSMIDLQQTDQAADGTKPEGLYDSSESILRERGGYTGHVAESSLYTKASLHPVATGALIAGLGIGAAYLLGSTLIPIRGESRNNRISKA